MREEGIARWFQLIDTAPGTLDGSIGIGSTETAYPFLLLIFPLKVEVLDPPSVIVASKRRSAVV